MPRRDDELEDERPRRRRPRDEDDLDRPARPRRRPRDEDDDDLPPPRKNKSSLPLVLGVLGGVLLLLCGGVLVGAWWLFGRAKTKIDQINAVAQENEDAAASRQNLKQIGVAAHNHEAILGSFPNNSYADRQNGGRPLLSWRVHLLPYLNQQALYNRFNLNEPWDGPTNRPLVNDMPAVYGTAASRARAGPGKTYYRGFSHPGAMFERPQAPGAPAPRITFASVTDGLSNTILVVEAGEAVEWTRPDDLDFGPGRPRPNLGGANPALGYCLVLMADSSVRRLRRTADDQTLRNLIGRNDGWVIPPGWDE